MRGKDNEGLGSIFFFLTNIHQDVDFENEEKWKLWEFSLPDPEEEEQPKEPPKKAPQQKKKKIVRERERGER